MELIQSAATRGEGVRTFRLGYPEMVKGGTDSPIESGTKSGSRSVARYSFGFVSQSGLKTYNFG